MKRLRENVDMEAEISATGDVIVEGHHVGQLDGFRFTADKSAEGEDAKAVKAAAAKALAAEFEKRSERFAASGNSDLAIGTDGVLRWLGSSVGSLVAGEEWLKPRLVLLADEQLSGPARDKVAARADRFVSHYIETHLKPLVDLGRADELSGIARGIGFRLIENHGIVQRREIADEIRSLDQDGRAALRRYGVRFGFYHVFIPALVKPAPAGLLTLLWALQNDGKDKPGYGDVVHLLSTGRTSLVPDAGFDSVFYKLAGYRHLGSRAVRVDILERLADLIRPALHWRDGGAGELPDGAFGGGRFFVTPAMMSILGATSEDMEAVLKSLGYRNDLAEAAEFETKLADLKAASAPADKQAAPDAEIPAEQPHGPMEPVSGDATLVAEAAEEVAGETVAPVAKPVQDTAAPTADAEPAPDAAAETEAPAEPEPELEPAAKVSPAEPETASDTAADPAAATEAAEDVEPPKPVMIWYQVRGERNRRGNRPQQADGPRKGKQPPNKFRGKRQDGDKKPGRGRPEAEMKARSPKREALMDPDSPFAKLAALKDQMKK